MKILLLDVDSITYELIKPEAKFYEEGDKKSVTQKDVLVLMTSIEEGDEGSVAEKAAADALDVAKKLGRKAILVYPFAHLSSELSDPKSAMETMSQLFKALENKGVDVSRSPFGWNKKLTIAIKGHPLAEQGRTYGKDEAPAKKAKKGKPAPINTAIVKKSDFSGLPDTDHRTIAEKLNLFSMQEVSPGMVYWHRNGLILYKQLTGFIREQLEKYDYEEISTPTLANLALWHVSGHIDHYKDNMFMFESANEHVGMKPMNCPSTILVYKSRNWSYRELPFRTAIFDKLYRNEISGALTGLFRVREFAQDDGHIFLREDQLEDEMVLLLKFVRDVYDTFGMPFAAKLSTMPDDHLGSEELWDKATATLKKSLESNKIPYTINDKDGAFYGPKIDFDVTDSMGRKWQCATIQVDYQLPLRFGLEYAGEDGKQHTPVMIHRAILGSVERFIGVLIEHYQGRFPTWLAPVQVRVVSISDQTYKYSEDVYNQLKAEKIRTYLDNSDKTLQYKIREGQMQQVPYLVVLGKKEQGAGTVTIRDRTGKQTMGIKLEDFIKSLKSEISERRSELGLK